jgi:hypothetical protein
MQARIGRFDAPPRSDDATRCTAEIGGSRWVLLPWSTGPHRTTMIFARRRGVVVGGGEVSGAFPGQPPPLGGAHKAAVRGASVPTPSARVSRPSRRRGSTPSGPSRRPSARLDAGNGRPGADRRTGVSKDDRRPSEVGTLRRTAPPPVVTSRPTPRLTRRTTPNQTSTESRKRPALRVWRENPPQPSARTGQMRSAINGWWT